jgi:DNA repair protein RadD
MRPRAFTNYIHITQIQELVERGYFAKTEYKETSFDRSQLKINSTGADFTEDSMSLALKEQGTNDRVVEAIGKLRKQGRKHIIVFTPSVAEAQYIAHQGGGRAVHAQTSKKDRDRILGDFKAGKIPFVTNVGILGIGFDFPALDTILIARPTMSLAMYYQWLGRGVRPHPDKDHCLIVDFVGNIKKFGRVEDLEVREGDHGWGIYSKGALLTNRDIAVDSSHYTEKKKSSKPLAETTLDFGKHSGKKLKNVPKDYLHWVWKNVDSKSWTSNVIRYIKEQGMFDKDERLADKPGRKPIKTKKQKDSKWKQEYKVEKVWENQLGQQLDKKLKIS